LTHGFTTASTPVWLIAALALASGITRSTGLTVYSTVGLAEMTPALMRDANTLAATSTQLAAGVAIAGATVALRIGDVVAGAGQAGALTSVPPRPVHLTGRVPLARFARPSVPSLCLLVSPAPALSGSSELAPSPR
jgi:hypothetical protein